MSVDAIIASLGAKVPEGQRARLAPAFGFLAQLEAAWTNAVATDHLRLQFYQLDHDWSVGGMNSDWNRVSRVVVSPAGALLGYCSASWDRHTNCITNLGAVSFDPGNAAFLEALLRFVEEQRALARWLRWSCVVGNPAMKLWKAYADAVGAEDAGIWRSYARLPDGTYADGVFWQVKGGG